MKSQKREQKSGTRAAGSPCGAWRNRIIGQANVDPRELIPHPLNWRQHPAEQSRALRGSLETIGWVRHILLNKRTGHVLDGHARIDQAIAHNEAEVPVTYVDLTEEEELLVLATLDPISSQSEANQTALDSLLEAVRTDDPGLNALLTELAHRESFTIKAIEVKPPPPVTWILIGIPTIEYGDIARTVEGIAAVPHVLLEFYASDGPVNKNG